MRYVCRYIIGSLNTLTVNKVICKDKEYVVLDLGFHRVKDFYYRKSIWKHSINVFSSCEEMGN